MINLRSRAVSLDDNYMLPLQCYVQGGLVKLPDSVCVLGGAGFFEWQSYLVGVGTGILTFLCFLFIWECLARLVLCLN